MSNALLKGETHTVNVRIKQSASLEAPPKWTLYDDESEEVLSGQASSAGGDLWSAIVTIPSTLVIPNGEMDMYVEFVGVTTDKTQVVNTKELTVVDSRDEWKSYGILWYKSPQALRETVTYQRKPTSITLEIKNGFGEGETLFQNNYFDPTPSASTSMGFAFDVEIPNVSLKKASGGWYPHQLLITAEFDSGMPDVVAKPIYTLTAQALSHVTSMKRFLDKARLDEIDPNIGWQDEELVHFLLEGAKYINGIGESSFWTAENMPSTLHHHLISASVMIALNARYLAEGFTEFDFQGANSQLNVNRRDTISYKIDELNSLLNDKLPKAKAEAIRTAGPGVPPEGSLQTNRKQVGSLGIQFGPMTNRASWWRQGNHYK